MDCIEYMRSLPDNVFDIAVCDPPYGKGNDDNLVGGRFGQRFEKYFRPSDGGARNHSPANIETLRGMVQTLRQADGTGCWEDGEKDTTSQRIHSFSGGTWAERYKIGGGGKAEAPQWDVAPPQEFFDELFRISRNQIIWGGNYFSLPPTRCFLVWRKTSISERFSMAMAEYAWTSFTGNAKVFDSPPQRRENSGKFHPTEKPLELYGWIYRNYVKDGETVFDPMMGSQASRISAYKMGIDYVGCEIDKYYYDKGCEWFERECHGITKTASGKTIIEQTLFEL